jgi:carbon storage regulator
MTSARLAPDSHEDRPSDFSTNQRKESAVLILSRKKDQVIRIGDDIQITVTEIRGDKVRIGVDAPRHITVHRQEIYEAIQSENAATDTDHD